MTRPTEIAAVTAFTEEFAHSLPRISAALDQVERDRSDRAAAHEAFRLMHAVKGAASMVGLAALSYLLNLAEDRLEASARAPQLGPPDPAVRASLPRFKDYMDAALTGSDTEPIAVQLAAILATDDDDPAAAVRELLAIDARELAYWRPTSEPPVETGSATAAFADIASKATGPSPAPAVPVSDERFSPVPIPRAGKQSVAETEFDLLPADDIPPELAEVFGQEAQDHLQTIARLTSQLSTGPQDRESLQELRRAVHTLKGAAGVVGYKGASRLAHRMEDLLDRLYEGAATMSSEAIRTLATASDALDDLISGAADPATLHATVRRLFSEFDALISAASPIAVPADVAAAIDAFGERQAPPSADDEGSSQGATMAVAHPESAEGRAIATSTGGTPQHDRRRGGDRRSLDDRRAGGPVFRVPGPRLNELLRAVSELVLNRSTFEQHHAGLAEQIDELRLSTARLRRVAQKLEVDYEARTLAGRLAPAVATGPHGFDELEFDRYTEFHLLTRELAETASDIATITTRVAETAGEFDNDLTRLARVTREVQDKTMEFRMVPLGSLWSRLDRTIRVTAEACGKPVDLALEGQDVSIDKSLLEEMADPLLHLVRNAVDHGIESPERRRAAGKPTRGRVTVRALHDGTDIIIAVEDDGAGLDLDRIRRTAIAKGLVTESDAATLADDAIHAFVFEPGFSTASHVTEVSGRGVGMDVVKSKVDAAGGRVEIASTPAGTTTTIRVPMTMAITRVLLVRTGGETFGLPLGAIAQIVRPAPGSLGRVAGKPVLTIDGLTYPLRDLADILGLPRSTTAPIAPPVVIANLGGCRIALAVDEVLHSRDAVVKTLGSHLRRVRGVWGATLFGDGTVVLILNPADLAGAADRPPARRSAVSAAPRTDANALTILIVDDSLSMRHVLSTAVRKAGWNPLPARDGLEALEILHRGAPRPDLVLLDVEMPRMDGFEFLSTVRGQANHAALPIVMLTSRGGDRHREKARALGATDYMVKPYQEDALLETITRLVKTPRDTDARAAS